MSGPGIPDCPTCHGKFGSLRGSWPSFQRPGWGGEVLFCPHCELGFCLVYYSRADFEVIRYTRDRHTGAFTTSDSPSRPHELFDPQQDGRFAPAKVSSILAGAVAALRQRPPIDGAAVSAPSAPPVFLEIVFRNADFPFDSRDAVEDPLAAALEEAGLGEVTGGGSGSDTCNIDVEVTDLEHGLALIRKTLLESGCRSSTVINQYQPERIAHRLQ